MNHSDKVKRLKDLEAEDARLRCTMSDLTLDKMILAEPPRETGKLRAVAPTLTVFDPA